MLRSIGKCIPPSSINTIVKARQFSLHHNNTEGILINQYLTGTVVGLRDNSHHIDHLIIRQDNAVRYSAISVNLDEVQSFSEGMNSEFQRIKKGAILRVKGLLIEKYGKQQLFLKH